jgi:hypothetical protein
MPIVPYLQLQMQVQATGCTHLPFRLPGLHDTCLSPANFPSPLPPSADTNTKDRANSLVVIGSGIQFIRAVGILHGSDHCHFGFGS